MPKLYSGREIVKRLRVYGFVVVSQKGSHMKLRGMRNGALHTTIVPNHKEVALGTLKSILKQADMSKKELDEA